MAMTGPRGAGEGQYTNKELVAPVTEMWKQILSDSDSTNFCWFTLNGKAYELLASGAEGMSGMAESVAEGKLHFGGIRVMISDKPTFFQVLFVPKGVNMVQKGKANVLKGAAFNEMTGCAGEVILNDGEISAEILQAAIADVFKCSPEEVSDE